MGNGEYLAAGSGIVPDCINGEASAGVYAKDVALKVIGEVKCNGLVGKVAQFYGEAVYEMTLSERITLCNMAAEGGALSAIIDPEKPEIEDADLIIDLSELEPLVAVPHQVDNVHSLKAVEGTVIDQVFIGSCTNGRFEDFAVAAEILRGRRISPDVRLYISPASRKQLNLLAENKILNCFLDAGAILLNPGCSLCFGSCQGIMDDGEKLLTTGNRNYKGRVGTPNSYIFIGSPATAAASAITGKITDPRKFFMESKIE